MIGGAVLDRKEIKQLAKNRLHNNWELAILSVVLVLMCSLIASVLTFGIGSVIVAGPLGLGLFTIYLAFIYGEETNWRELFCPFRDRFEDSFIVGLIYALIGIGPAAGMIVALLVVVMGVLGSGVGFGFSAILAIMFIVAVDALVIYLIYGYSEALVILQKEKDTKGFEALRKSRIMTNGKKMSLFVFDLSFIGWFILIGLSFGLAGIYVIPYYLCSRLILLDSIYVGSEGMDFSRDADLEAVRNIRNKVAEGVRPEPSDGYQGQRGYPEYAAGNQAQGGFPGNDPGNNADAAAGGVKFCRFCGEELPADAMFCGKCGKPQGGQ